MNDFVPCYRIQDSKGNKVIVKGDLNKWIEQKGLKWKEIKGERRLYAGNRRCSIEQISPDVMMAMQYVFNNDKYDPTHV